MKLPLSWLASMVDLDLPVETLADIMSLNGLEVEEIARPGAGTTGVRTAEVLSIKPHPDADKLRVVRVTGESGQGEVEVVCGAWNFDVGDRVLHALPGGFVPGVAGADGSRGLMLSERAIRGVTSAGMLASSRELELGEDHDGIVVLPPEVELGVSLADLLPVGEPVVEIAVQPDRGDHLSVLGVARDLAAILDVSWQAPAVPDPVDAPTLPVALETDRCASFHTWVVEDVKVGPSPLWLRQRLAQCGVRSIDVVVDVTNLVMLELGQPLHAFDLDQLQGPKLTVREAQAGESLTTLDDTERTLVAGDVVIEDAERIVSIAGVMGGQNTEVGANTTRVLIEAAVWDPVAIRATSRRLGLVSEASQRFERSVDPQGAARAAARAAQLLVELAGGRMVGTEVAEADTTPAFATRQPVAVNPERIRALLALDLDAKAQAGLLERAGCSVEVTDATMTVTPPTWRADLNRPADIAEEVARLHGYDQIPATLPALKVNGGLTASQQLARAARDSVLAAGFHEAVTRPFVGDDAIGGVVPSAQKVVLANPLAKDASAMRPSLLEGLLRAVRHNVGQGRPGTAIAEFGRLFRPVDDPLADVLDALLDDWRWNAPDGSSLPVQPRAVAFAAQGLKFGPGWLEQDNNWSVYDIVAVIDDVVRRIAPPDDGWQLDKVAVERDGLHPGRTVSLQLKGQEVGVIGQLHPAEADRRDLPEPVVVGELLLEPFLASVPQGGYPPVPAPALVRRPALTVDVALVADEQVPYSTLVEVVRTGAGAVLDDVRVFDEYRGEQLGDGQRSVAMRMRLQDPERQLTDADAEQIIDAVEAAAEKVGASLRR